jgi:hypothetical protein
MEYALVEIVNICFQLVRTEGNYYFNRVGFYQFLREGLGPRKLLASDWRDLLTRSVQGLYALSARLRLEHLRTV